MVKELAGANRHALHAYAIQFKHPSSGSEFTAIADTPEDFQQIWQNLEGSPMVMVGNGRNVF